MWIYPWLAGGVVWCGVHVLCDGGKFSSMAVCTCWHRDACRLTCSHHALCQPSSGFSHTHLPLNSTSYMASHSSKWPLPFLNGLVSGPAAWERRFCGAAKESSQVHYPFKCLPTLGFVPCNTPPLRKTVIADLIFLFKIVFPGCLCVAKGSHVVHGMYKCRKGGGRMWYVNVCVCVCVCVHVCTCMCAHARVCVCSCVYVRKADGGGSSNQRTCSRLQRENVAGGGELRLSKWRGGGKV